MTSQGRGGAPVGTMPERGGARPHGSAPDQKWTTLHLIGRGAPFPAPDSPSQRIPMAQLTYNSSKNAITEVTLFYTNYRQESDVL
ncbi:hypothetical protein AJ78_06889 [Emergomyces pasteurianus Ep9510]|uniref:Uncharacterized protein n=1 Tax=Emergomyces pasteurianus Ep9510 TaxID=1447872 RepID=A0A1J9Q9C9_9EURO|nr:hypothetical protein AJ78_06889 [Emergomyces pasteurianus Ep9510]